MHCSWLNVDGEDTNWVSPADGLLNHIAIAALHILRHYLARKGVVAIKDVGP